MTLHSAARAALLTALAATLAAGCAGTPKSPPTPADGQSGPGDKVAPGETRRVASARVDYARIASLQAYGLLMEGWTDSALVLFQRSLARSGAEHTPDAGGRWGLALSYRLSGRISESDTLVMGLAHSPEPEVLLAEGWFDEVRGDTSGALDRYARARTADSTWSPPYLRAAGLLAGRGAPREARELLVRAAAMGDTSAMRVAERLTPPPPPTPAESLLAAASSSPALTRLQWAALLRAHGAPPRPPRFPAPELTHFRAARDSLRDMEGTPWVGLVRGAVMQGGLELYPDGSFRPDDQVSRGRFALWLDLFDWPADSTGTAAECADVPSHDYRRGAVERALGRGLMTPRAAGRFEPEAPMSGEEAVRALRRAAEVR
ncbi:MAG: S-layer homology domain-containing protein [Candidatus Eisenbacteria bacterium]|nr:S-layer homology domain-containing protein [Candidatus Eisenbacteria bacterium]